MKLINFIILFVVIMLLIGCGPAKIPVYEVVGANETAFVLPLEGENLEKQKQFKSIEYLESKKVAAKRIMIPVKKFKKGRWPGNFVWERNVLVIKVDRAPVTREWAEEESQGTSNKNEALYMESKESIEFGIPLTVTAYVKEENTAKFLYYYAGKQLKTIIDLNVRGYCQAELSKQFSQHELEVGRGMKAQFIKTVFDSAKIFFEEKGITIDVIGAAGGLRYRDESIQTAINEKFAAEIDKKKAKDIREAAEEFVKAAEAQKKKIALEIQQKEIDIQMKYAEAWLTRWNGQLPERMLPSGVIPFLNVEK